MAQLLLTGTTVVHGPTGMNGMRCGFSSYRRTVHLQSQACNQLRILRPTGSNTPDVAFRETNPVAVLARHNTVTGFDRCWLPVGNANLAALRAGKCAPYWSQ